MKHRLLLISLNCLLLAVLSGCGLNAQVTPAAQSHQTILSNCPDHPLSSSITTTLPLPAPHSLYFGSAGNLYALNAGNGSMLWCKQVKLSGNFPCPGSCPPPPSMSFGQPTVVAGVVYVCASGYEGYTYAFRADNGSLLWRVKSDCAVTSMPFSDYALPIVDHNIIYTGSYALQAQDGKILWSTALAVSFQSLVDGVLYANSEDTMYALNAKDGSVRWHYNASDHGPIGGPLVIANKRLYFGTLDSVNQEQKSALYVLNTADGSLLWKFSMGAYSGATLLNDLVYVSSRDQYLYALHSKNGSISWRYKSVFPVYNTATGANNVLYINMDGPYALNAQTGNVIWHQSFASSQSVYFTPSTVADHVLYFARIDGSGNSTLYALNANTGTTYWHNSISRQVTPLTVI